MTVVRFLLGALMRPFLIFFMLIILVVTVGANPAAPFLLVFLLVGWVPIYAIVAFLYSIRSLVALITLTNSLPLAIYGYNCLKNGCLHHFDGWDGEYLSMVLLCFIFSFWAFVLWLFIRERRSINDSDS